MSHSNRITEIRPSGESFSFDVVLATEYGITEALLIRHFQHWIRINQKNSKNFRENRTWTFQTIQQIADHFPFLNYEKVKYAVEKLVKKGVILIGNFNKIAIDKTHWYAFVREDIFVPDLNSNNFYERENSPSIGKIPSPSGKIPSPIPDTIQEDTKQLSSSPEKNEEIDDDIVFTDKEKKQLNDFTEKQIKEAHKITKENCLQSKNSVRAKYFFTTIKNLKKNPKNIKILPFQQLSKHFKNGQLYNNAECNITKDSISFTRGMKHEQIDFKYFSWYKFEEICKTFGINFKREKDGNNL